MKICCYKNPHLKGLPPRLGVIYNNQIIDPHLNFVAEYEREAFSTHGKELKLSAPLLSVRFFLFTKNLLKQLKKDLQLHFLMKKWGT